MKGYCCWSENNEQKYFRKRRTSIFIKHGLTALILIAFIISLIMD